MIKIILSITIAILLSPFAHSFTLTAKEKKYIDKDTIRVGVIDLYPFIFINRSHKVDGISKDIIEILVKKHNLNTKYIRGTKKEILEKFNNNEIDIIPYHLKQTNILKNVTKSIAIKQIQNSTYINKDINKDSLLFLNDKKHFYVEGDFNTYDINNTSPNINLTKGTLEDTMNNLLLEKIDAVSGNEIVIDKYIKNNQITKFEKLSFFYLAPINYQFLITSSKPELVKIINKSFNELSYFDKANIFHKWQQLNYFERIASYIKNYAFIFAVLTVIIFVVLIYFSFILKKSLHRFKNSQLRNNLESNKFKEKVIKNTIELNEKASELQIQNLSLNKKVQEETIKRIKHEEMLIKQSRHAAMGEMIAMIAHQWRQPLNSLAIIIQNIELAFKVNKLTEEYLEQQVDKSRQLTTHMSSTINDFQNFFKPNKEKTTFYLNTIVDDIVNILHDSCSQKEIKLDINCSTHVKLNGLKNELSQVILNILNNAVDAFAYSNVQSKNIKITITQNDKYGAIAIYNNASNIKEDILYKIFEPYFTTKSSKNGTGLGLYMSKIIVEQNFSGKLSVQNFNEGVVFSIKIPKYQ